MAFNGWLGNNETSVSFICNRELASVKTKKLQEFVNNFNNYLTIINRCLIFLLFWRISSSVYSIDITNYLSRYNRHREARKRHFFQPCQVTNFEINDRLFVVFGTKVDKPKAEARICECSRRILMLKVEHFLLSETLANSALKAWVLEQSAN